MKRLAVTIMATLTVSVAIAQRDTTLAEVVVTGTRNATDVRHLPMTISVVKHSELTQQHRQSVLPTVGELVPGVFVTSRGMLGYGVSRGAAGDIKVRGIGGAASMLVLIDGQPQYAGLYGHAIPDAYQTMMAERVEVLRGPASLLYGSNAMGGVMNIVTRQAREDGLHATAELQAGSYGTVTANASARWRSGKWSLIGGLGYGRTDSHRANGDFEQYNGFAKAVYDINDQWKAQADVNMTYFDNQNPGETFNPYIDNRMKITRGMASASVLNDYGHTSGALRFYYSWGHHDVYDGYHPGDTPPTYNYMHDDLMAGMSLYQSASLFSGNRITAGVDFQLNGGHAWNRPNNGGEKTELIDKTENAVAGYVEMRQDIDSWLTIDAGFRVEHHSQTGTELVPQGGMTFRFNDNSDIKAMVSKGFRNPTMREMYMFPPANSELEPERIMNYELAYSHRLMDGDLRIGANIFYLKADNLIETVRTGGKPRNINTGEAENYGAEAEASWKLNNWLALNANYSYLHMERKLLAAPEHKFYIGAHCNFNRLSLTSGLQYVANMYTATGDNEKKESFALLNITAGYRLTPQLQLFVRGENLLAQRYEINAGFPMPKATMMAGVKWSM